jgi:hypothetical protein
MNINSENIFKSIAALRILTVCIYADTGSVSKH